MKNETIIYEKLGCGQSYNLITEHKDCYMISTNKTDCCIDKDEKILHAVIDAIENFGLCYGNNNIKNSSVMYFSDGHIIICSLTQVIYAALTNTNIDDYKGSRFRYKDGNPLNLTKENIIFDTVGILTHTIKGERYIILIDRESNVRSFTNYTDELYDIIKQFRYTCVPKRKKFYITSCHNTQLTHLVWAYHKLGANKDNILEVVESFKKDCLNGYGKDNCDKWVTLDHKQSYKERITNDTIENLWLMPYKDNLLKSNVTAKLTDDCNFKVTDGGQFWIKKKELDLPLELKLRYGMFNELQDFEIYKVDDDKMSDSYVNDLKSFQKNGELPSGKIKVPLGTFYIILQETKRLEKLLPDMLKSLKTRRK